MFVLPRAARTLLAVSLVGGLAACSGAGRFLREVFRERPPAPLDSMSVASDARVDSMGYVVGSFVGEGTSRAVHLLSSDTGFIAALARRYRPALDGGWRPLACPRAGAGGHPRTRGPSPHHRGNADGRSSPGRGSRRPHRGHADRHPAAWQLLRPTWRPGRDHRRRRPPGSGAVATRTGAGLLYPLQHRDPPPPTVGASVGANRLPSPAHPW